MNPLLIRTATEIDTTDAVTLDLFCQAGCHTSVLRKATVPLAYEDHSFGRARVIVSFVDPTPLRIPEGRCSTLVVPEVPVASREYVNVRSGITCVEHEASGA
jgi:hypothetical protein